MTVVKRKRKESPFEVFHHFYRVRKDITDLLLRDFGYNEKKARQHLEKMFGGKTYNELDETERLHYEKRKKRTESFEKWFIIDQRKAVMNCLRDIQENVAIANSIYPSCPKEFQDLFNSWFNNHYKIMSKQQRFNMNELY